MRSHDSLSPLLRRELTRRWFLAGLGGGALAALAACTSRGTSTVSPRTTPTPPADVGALEVGGSLSGVIYGELLPTLPRGGDIDISFFQEPPTLDILSNTLGAISLAADPAHDFLERYDHTGKLTVSLAEKLEFVDPTTYRYTLREAKFHNGRNVVAEDVKNTLDYIRDPKVASTKAGQFEDLSINVIDDRTLEVKLTQPNQGVRHLFPRMPIIPIEERDTLTESPIGCGPFLFREWVKESHVSYERNPDYWNPDAPRLDNFRMSFRADQPAAAQAFLAGENDYLYAVSKSFVPQFLEQPESEVGTITTEYGFRYIAFNNSVAPFDDADVRRAWELAIDRDAMARVGVPGLSRPVSSGPLLPEHPWYPADLDHPRDVEGAKSLLVGKTNLNTTVMVIDETTEAVGQVLKSNLADVGIDIGLERVDVATFVDRRIAGDFTAVVSGWFTHVEPSAVLDVLFVTDGPSNYWKYSNPKVDELLAQGRAEADGDKRKQIYHDAMKTIFIDDAGFLAVATEGELQAYRPYTNGDQFLSNPGPLFHNPILSRET